MNYRFDIALNMSFGKPKVMMGMKSDSSQRFETDTKYSTDKYSSLQEDEYSGLQIDLMSIVEVLRGC